MLVTWSTWETMSLAVARSKTDGVLNCTSWQHIPTLAYMCMESNHSLVGKRDDLLHARVPLAVATKEPTQETPAQAYPQYPDQGEFWLGRPVTIGMPSAAPIPAAPIPTAPVNSCCCTHSCSWPPPPPPPPVRVRPALSEQRGKPKCCPPALKCSVATLMLSCSTVYLSQHDQTLMAWPLIWYYLIALYMFIWVVTGSVDRVHT